MVFWIVGIVMLVMCIAFIAAFINTRQFVTGEMQSWKDIKATVTESAIVGDPRVRNEGDSENDDYRYYVSYMYVAEFSAWGEMFSYTYEGENTGKLRNRFEDIPEIAFVIPNPGDSVDVIYDPETKGAYKIGSLAEWSEKGSVTLKNLIGPIIFGILAVVFLFMAIRARRGKGPG